MTDVSSFDARKHCRRLAVLFSIFALLAVALSIMLFIVIAIPKPNEDPGMVSFINWMLGIIGALGIALATLPSLGAWALFKRKPWAKTFSTIVSALYIPTVPLGTALGAYGLWILSKPETARYLDGSSS